MRGGTRRTARRRPDSIAPIGVPGTPRIGCSTAPSLRHDPCNSHSMTVAIQPPAVAMRLATPLWLLSAAACGGAAESSTDSAFGAGSTATEADSPDSSTLDSTAPPADVEPPVWVALDGVLDIVQGEPTTESSLTWSAYDDDAAQTCTAALPVVAAAIDLAPADADGALAWWTIQTDPAPDCVEGVPATVGVGFGPWSAELAPAADHAGLDVTDQFSLLLDAGAQGVWLIGAAGSVPTTVTATTTRTESPVPDGTWSLRGLVLLPWADLTDEAGDGGTP